MYQSAKILINIHIPRFFTLVSTRFVCWQNDRNSSNIKLLVLRKKRLSSASGCKTGVSRNHRNPIRRQRTEENGHQHYPSTSYTIVRHFPFNSRRRPTSGNFSHETSSCPKPTASRLAAQLWVAMAQGGLLCVTHRGVLSVHPMHIKSKAGYCATRFSPFFIYTSPFCGERMRRPAMS